jgi:type I restriction enzyme, S subunit
VNLSRGIARICPDAGKVLPGYLALFFRSHAVADAWNLLSQGTTFSEVSIASVRELAVALPPLAEQETIIRVLTERTTKFSELFGKIRAGIALLRERRTALISAAVTGQIDVRSHTPTH